MRTRELTNYEPVNFENDKLASSALFFFWGFYSNLYNCYIPRIGGNQYGDEVLLHAPLYNLAAIYKFAELFPCSTPEEQKAFIRVGYPLLEIKEDK